MLAQRKCSYIWLEPADGTWPKADSVTKTTITTVSPLKADVILDVTVFESSSDKEQPQCQKMLK